METLASIIESILFVSGNEVAVADISEKLGVSSGVVKNHVADMLFKTGFRSRTQLAVRARESGLVILDKTDDEI